MTNSYKTSDQDGSNPEEILKNTLETLDISLISGVYFQENGGISYTIKLDSIKKFALLITKKSGKSSFEPGELSEERDFLIKYYKSSLRKNDYDLLVNHLTQWVQKGGKFQLIYKEVSGFDDQKKYKPNFGKLYKYIGWTFLYVPLIISIGFYYEGLTSEMTKSWSLITITLVGLLALSQVGIWLVIPIFIGCLILIIGRLKTREKK